MTRWERAVDLRFHGPRFDSGALDVDVMSEIVAYKGLVENVADALWRSTHPARLRIDKGFDASFSLRMSGLTKGSALIQIERSRTGAQTALPFVGDEFDESMKVIVEAIDCVGSDRSLPTRFPRAMVRRFGALGKRLAATEWLEIAQPGEPGVRFDGERRSKLLSLVESKYEDTADAVGFVLATSVRKERFELYKTLDSAEPIEVPLPSAFEPLVLDVARDYHTVRLRVRGRAAFDANGQMLRFVSVDGIDRYGADESLAIDNSSLLAALQALGASIPEDEARRVPPDASTNLDAHLRRGMR